MELLLEETRAGNMKDIKASLLNPALQRICDKLAVEFPQYPWSLQKVQDKMWNEKKRYWQFITILSISGVSYDDASGLIQAPESIWESFLARDPKAGWLRTQPLGNREVYAEVFHRERATGKYIKPATELLPRNNNGDIDFDQLSDLDHNRGLKDNNDNNDDGDIDNIDNLSSISTTRQTSKISTPTPSTRGRQHEVSQDSLVQVAHSLNCLASSNATVPGGYDIRIAVKSFFEGFGNKLSSKDINKVLKKLKDPIEALVWNTLPLEFRVEQVNEWTRE